LLLLEETKTLEIVFKLNEIFEEVVVLNIFLEESADIEALFIENEIYKGNGI
jgi:hypothetical protein